MSLSTKVLAGLLSLMACGCEGPLNFEQDRWANGTRVGTDRHLVGTVRDYGVKCDWWNDCTTHFTVIMADGETVAVATRYKGAAPVWNDAKFDITLAPNLNEPGYDVVVSAELVK